MRFFTAKEVADIRHKTEGALTKERNRGEGPPWIRDNGRILYPEDGLRRYMEDLTVYNGTQAAS